MVTRWDVVKKARSRLNGRSIGNEVSAEDLAWLKRADLIVMFGASDDLVEIRGAINDEISLYDGGEVHFINGKLYERECEDEDCPHEHKIQKGTIDVRANWNVGDISWTFETDIPHETFDVLEGDEVFCRGIIFCRESIN